MCAYVRACVRAAERAAVTRRTRCPHSRAVETKEFSYQPHPDDGTRGRIDCRSATHPAVCCSPLGAEHRFAAAPSRERRPRSARRRPSACWMRTACTHPTARAWTTSWSCRASVTVRACARAAFREEHAKVAARVWPGPTRAVLTHSLSLSRSLCPLRVRRAARVQLLAGLLGDRQGFCVEVSRAASRQQMADVRRLHMRA